MHRAAEAAGGLPRLFGALLAFFPFLLLLPPSRSRPSLFDIPLGSLFLWTPLLILPSATSQINEVTRRW